MKYPADGLGFTRTSAKDSKADPSKGNSLYKPRHTRLAHNKDLLCLTHRVNHLYQSFWNQVNLAIETRHCRMDVKENILQPNAWYYRHHDWSVVSQPRRNSSETGTSIGFLGASDVVLNFRLICILPRMLCLLNLLHVRRIWLSDVHLNHVSFDLSVIICQTAARTNWQILVFNRLGINKYIFLSLLFFAFGTQNSVN